MTEKIVSLHADDPLYWMRRGSRALDGGDLDEAGHCMDEVLARDPDDVSTLSARARVFLACGQPDRALSLLEQACHLASDQPEIWNNKGVALARTERFDEAEEAFCLALRIRPGDTETLHNRALTRLQRGAVPEAQADLTILVVEEPWRAETWEHLGVTHLHQGQLREARQAFRQAALRGLAGGGSRLRALALLGAVGILGMGIRSGRWGGVKTG